MCEPIEIIKDRLYWISSETTPANEPKTFFFNIDNDLVYEPFFSDFGPLDIGKTVRFVQELDKLLQCSQFTNSKIYHHTSLKDNKRANAAFLICAFQVMILGKTAEEAWEPLSSIKPEFIPFRDALFGSCDYKCTILDCLRGIEQAIKLKWFNIKTFDLHGYETLSKIENGDVNWIIPGKILAFSGPARTCKDGEGCKRFVPEDYAPIFKKIHVGTVVRLNNSEYDPERFKKFGLHHYDLIYNDTSCPNEKMVRAFIELCGESRNGIAVHCKAGLGQTGTMIACYIMERYKFPARNLIGWMRLCRPGSILGKQQQFLIDREKKLLDVTNDVTVVHSEIVVSQNLDGVNSPAQQQPYVSKPKQNLLQKTKTIAS